MKKCILISLLLITPSTLPIGDDIAINAGKNTADAIVAGLKSPELLYLTQTIGGNTIEALIAYLHSLPITGVGFAGSLYALSMIKMGIERMIESEPTHDEDNIDNPTAGKKHTATGIVMFALSITTIGKSRSIVQWFTPQPKLL